MGRDRRSERHGNKSREIGVLQFARRMQGFSGVSFLGETLCNNLRLARDSWRKCAVKSPRRWSASLEQIAAPSVPKRLRKGDLVDLKIEKISLGGAGIAYLPDGPDVAPEDVGLTVYTPKGCSPGDVIRCSITKVRRGKSESLTSGRQSRAVNSRAYAESFFVERLSVSPAAMAARCSHFGNFRLGGGGCGGCSTMEMKYESQLGEKQAQMEALFRNYEVLDAGALRQILPSPKIWNYRNKMEFSYGRKWYAQKPDKSKPRVKDAPVDFSLGLHAPQRFDKVVEINRCHIQEETANDILSFVRARGEEMLLEPFDPLTKTGYMRNIAIRTARNAKDQLEIMVNIITSPCEIPGRLLPLANAIVENFPEVVCVVQNMPKNNVSSAVDPSREKLVAGPRRYIEQNLCGLAFQISANSFFQTNAYQAEVLYRTVAKAAALSRNDVVVDLFCGTGTIGLTLAKYCRKVYGLELVDAAVEDAQRNAKRNGITNAEFVKINLEKLKDSFTLACGSDVPDVIVVDPPRAGLHKTLVQQLARCQARRIVYVSCNPTSQLRDLQYLQELAPNKYRVSEVQPVCMFPHTSHVESVVTLDLSICS